mmetsp:Transcript_3257/g.10202  ORF Transcript_3257/g.10202 Transcript_3257/m.10202 type:complete len:348 (+) Transcript_3257:50-1093(+)
MPSGGDPGAQTRTMDHSTLQHTGMAQHSHAPVTAKPHANTHSLAPLTGTPMASLATAIGACGTVWKVCPGLRTPARHHCLHSQQRHQLRPPCAPRGPSSLLRTASAATAASTAGGRQRSRRTADRGCCRQTHRRCLRLQRGGPAWGATSWVHAPSTGAGQQLPARRPPAPSPTRIPTLRGPCPCPCSCPCPCPCCQARGPWLRRPAPAPAPAHGASSPAAHPPPPPPPPPPLLHQTRPHPLTPRVPPPAACACLRPHAGAAGRRARGGASAAPTRCPTAGSEARRRGRRGRQTRSLTGTAGGPRRRHVACDQQPQRGSCPPRPPSQPRPRRRRPRVRHLRPSGSGRA